jgi:O-antigen biosynthesis protein
MTTIAVCAIFKDEGPNLIEWVAYHRAVGVDYFFLYDNESTDDGASILLSSPLKDYVTVMPFAGRPVQQAAYKHFIDFHAKNWEWVAFIDLDEFIHPIEADSIKYVLPRYKSYSVILIHYLVFGPNGHDDRPNGLVIENYTRRLPEDHEINRHVKSLVRTAHLVGLLGTSHVFDIKGQMCNSRGETAPGVPIQDKICHDVICLNHYYTKSREDWDVRLRRGSVDMPVDRINDPEYRTFNEYARLATVPDERITRFSERVRRTARGR